jgi:hypothetical protein
VYEKKGKLANEVGSKNKKGTPLFLVSVASKGFSQTVSLLFATLTGRSVSVAAKGLKAGAGSDLHRVGGGSVDSDQAADGEQGADGGRNREVGESS